MNKKVYQYQLRHVVFAIMYIVIMYLSIEKNYVIMSGGLWGLSSNKWFWIAAAVPILHQVYVMLVWRYELHTRFFTSRWGLERSFRWYSIGFTVLFVSRLISIGLLAISNSNTLPVKPVIAYVIGTLMIPPALYLFYSVKRYFTFRRAFGIDHFDPDFNEPFVKKGIFRFTNNGMYIFGFFVLYLPGFFHLSQGALLAAVFNHLYIWVHYYCTELPDMQYIYGIEPGGDEGESE